MEEYWTCVKGNMFEYETLSWTNLTLMKEAIGNEQQKIQLTFLKENEIKENTFKTLVSLKSVYDWENGSMPKSNATTLANPNVIKKSVGKLPPAFHSQPAGNERANEENNGERKIFIVKNNEMKRGKMDRGNCAAVSSNLNGGGGIKMMMNSNLAEGSEKDGCRQSQEESARLARERIQNKEAAARYRHRQRQLAYEIQEELVQLEGRNSQLRMEVGQMRGEIETTRTQLGLPPKNEVSDNSDVSI